MSQGVNRKNGSKQKDAVFTIMDEAIACAVRDKPQTRFATFEQFERSGGKFVGRLLSACTALLKKNPLTYIADDARFLFRQEKNGIVLAAASVNLLRRFRPLIYELAQSRWIAHLQSIASNAALLGEKPGQTLRDFLFNPVRGEALIRIRHALIEATGSRRCFYCGKEIKENDACHVDHFLPFSRYADTELFNFVIACSSCNCSKSNWLAGVDGVTHWVERNREHGKDLIEASCLDADNPIACGEVEVARMALRLYEDDSRRQVPLWCARARKRGESPVFSHDAKDFEIILPSLGEHLRSMQRLHSDADLCDL